MSVLLSVAVTGDTRGVSRGIGCVSVARLESVITIRTHRDRFNTKSYHTLVHNASIMTLEHVHANVTVSNFYSYITRRADRRH